MIPGPLTFDDSSHSYHLNGQRCTNISSLPTIVTNQYRLELYRRRQIADAFVRQPELIEQIAAASDNNDAIDRILEPIAGPGGKARRGIFMHRALQLVLLGRADELLTDQQRADATALLRTLDRYRLTPTEWVENFVVFPEFLVAGRFDAILEKPDGTPVMVDLKSGANAVTYPQSVAIQLALYSNAAFMAASVQTTGDRSVVTEWSTLPENLDLARGYVLLVEPGEPVGTLHRINIQHGWAAAQLALRIMNWRKDFNYGRQLAREVKLPRRQRDEA
jgi:hypothetical protein